MSQRLKGRLIVIDGIDGAGKTTQSMLLVNYFKKEGIRHHYIHFPRYDTFFGQIVARFLRGEFGKLETVSPYLASIVYALDREAVKDEINNFLTDGVTVVVDRYTTSNIAHQGAKFTENLKREEFIRWIIELEYKELRIPKEDLVIFLDTPLEKALELRGQTTKQYLARRQDIHEHDENHQKKSQEVYRYLADTYPRWKRVMTVDAKGAMLSPEAINRSILKLI